MNLQTELTEEQMLMICIKEELESREQIKNWCNDPTIHKPIADWEQSKKNQYQFSEN